MKEFLIRKGKSHILVSMDMYEAFSFDDFGEGACELDAVSAYMGAGLGITPVNIVSIVGKGKISDIYYMGKHALVNKRVLDCHVLLKKLPLESSLPYRVKRGEGVTQILLALSAKVSVGDVEKALDIVGTAWESL